MPKLKTHKGAKRRLHITGTGKVMHRKGQISHLRKAKSKRAKSMISIKLMASTPMQKNARKPLPYGLNQPSPGQPPHTRRQRDAPSRPERMAKRPAQSSPHHRSKQRGHRDKRPEFPPFLRPEGR